MECLRSWFSTLWTALGHPLDPRGGRALAPNSALSPRSRLLEACDEDAVARALDEKGVSRRLLDFGYSRLHVVIDRASVGDRARVFGWGAGRDHLLIEIVLERSLVAGRPVLYLNWINLRHPLGEYGRDRPRLPGQDAPGLGVAAEILSLLRCLARDLGLKGVAMRPSWFHSAYLARHRFRFVEPARQKRFEALVRQLAPLSVAEASAAVAGGRVWLDGRPYLWEPEKMVDWLHPLAKGLRLPGLRPSEEGAARLGRPLRA